MKINEAQLIPNEQKCNLGVGDIFDKIINLKLNCHNKTTGVRESFVIRSDYELVWLKQTLDNNGFNIGDGTYLIRRCSMKPSIRVQTKMVTSNTSTAVDVYVNNFFLLTPDGKHLRSFNESNYVIETIEIAMGYWGQFKLLNNAVPTYEEYFNIEAKNGADKIIVKDAIKVMTDKLPPDSVLHIHGYVGEIFSSPVAISPIVTPIKALEKPVMSTGNTLEQVLFENITRRYFNKASVIENGELSKLRKNVPVSDTTDLPVALFLTEDEKLMTKEDAEKYGVKVYLSPKAKELELTSKMDSEDNKASQNIYFEAGWTIGQTVARIMSFLDAELEFTFSNRGELLIYTPKEMVENIQSLTDEFDKDGAYKHSVFANELLYNNKLPAVYNINVDAVATIVCPFFTFIEPFQYVEFASRYALTSTVAYYASYAPTIYRFLVISALVSFATQDADNEVQITAVSAKEYKEG